MHTNDFAKKLDPLTGGLIHRRENEIKNSSRNCPSLLDSRNWPVLEDYPGRSGGAGITATDETSQQGE